MESNSGLFFLVRVQRNLLYVKIDERKIEAAIAASMRTIGPDILMLNGVGVTESQSPLA